MSSRQAGFLLAAVVVALILMGLGLDVGLLIALSLGLPLALLSLWLCKWLDPEGEIGLDTIFLVALALRFVVSAGVQLFVYQSHPGLFAPDENDYHGYARLVAERLRDVAEGNAVSQPLGRSSAHGLIWTAASIYYVVGDHVLVPKFLHCVMGAWSAVTTALLARHIFPAAVARRAGFLAAVFPSLVLWSGLLVKDVWTLLGAQLALLGFLEVRKRFSPLRLGVFLLGLVLMTASRPYEIIFVALGILGSFLFDRSQHPLRNGVLFAVLALLLFFVIQSSGAQQQISPDRGPPSILAHIEQTRRNYRLGADARMAGSAIDTSLVDTSTPLGLLLWMPLGLVFFFLAPLPFTGKTFLSNSTAPEMIVWYLLLPSVYRGFRRMFRVGERTFWPLVLFVIAATASWALAITNVGSMYRYRAQVLFFPLILIAADQIYRKEERELGDAPGSTAPEAVDGAAAAATAAEDGQVKAGS